MTNSPDKKHDQRNSYLPKSIDISLDFLESENEKKECEAVLRHHISWVVEEFAPWWPIDKERYIHTIATVANNFKKHGAKYMSLRLETTYDEKVGDEVLCFVVTSLKNIDAEGYLKERCIYNADIKGWWQKPMHVVLYQAGDKRIIKNTMDDDNLQVGGFEKESWSHLVAAFHREKADTSPRKMDFDFNLPEQEAEKLYSDIRGLLIEKLQNFMFFSDLPPNTIHMIISELVKNIKDHAKTKGYVMIEKDPAPLPGQELLHFVVGDDGPGIAATAESIDNFLQTGFSNGWAKNKGLGGSTLRSAAELNHIHITMYDNGEKRVINDALEEYDRKPEGIDMSKGAHFIGTFIL